MINVCFFNIFTEIHKTFCTFFLSVDSIHVFTRSFLFETSADIKLLEGDVTPSYQLLKGSQLI